MIESVDRLAAWNLVATVDAFLSSGLTPAERMRWIIPTGFANTQGTGIGGMLSTRTIYLDALLGETAANDVLQEALPNVIAAHAVQSYLGGYGAMVHPVAACATAAVTIEEGVDKIHSTRPAWSSPAASTISASRASSASARCAPRRTPPRCALRASRSGASAVPTTAVAAASSRARVAARSSSPAVMSLPSSGLPVLGVVAYAGAFADGIHTSIPAPGLGALGAGVGGVDSPLAKGLAKLGLGADDLAVISKHDTSTAANDPNESQLHEKLAGLWAARRARRCSWSARSR